MKDIQIVDIDRSAKNRDYEKTDIVDLTKISGNWIVPEEGPFYKDSLRVLKGGLDIESSKFKAVEEVTDLTVSTGKAVCLYIELTDDVIASRGEVEVIYQRVGKPVISVKTLLDMLEDMVISGKPVDFDTQIGNKPDTYYPARHGHDIQNPEELVGFGGLVELFTMFTNQQKYDGPRTVELLDKLQTEMYSRLNYTQKLKWGAIISHSRNYINPHDVKPVDVDAGNIPNYFTATPQQDSEGQRSDLFSTPRGLARLITEVQPVTEDYLLQGELPFGYYGSGIYLPPPITGSFEGLGGDTENGAFNLEGNGWMVMLFRAFDGRVKNLYYAYRTDFTDRDAIRTPWLNTYVQYQHPTITAAGKSPNLTIDGSDGQVLMLGVQNKPEEMISGSGNWWICAANSTFDPNSHTLKAVDMNGILSKMQAMTGTGIIRPTCFKISKVGDWVYLFITADSFQGDDAANYSTRFRANNWQTVMFRFPYKDLLDTTKSTITFTQVNVTYDTLWRERRSNKASFIPQRMVFANAEKTLLSEQSIKYSRPITGVYLNRKKGWIIVPNPNNPRLARVKMLVCPYADYVDPATNGRRSFGGGLVVNYEWDVVSNTFTMDPRFSVPTLNMDNGQYINPTQAQEDYAIIADWNNLNQGFVNPNGSWVPGYGYIVMRSLQVGTPPFETMHAQINRTGDIARDYESMYLPNRYLNSAGQRELWRAPFYMRSPFGVAGFPRLFSDLYSLTSGLRAAPIEIFVAENEKQSQTIFYRLTEGTSDDGYTKRDSLQSKFIPWDIYGRKTNSSFGKVDGLTMNIPYVNRPRRKTASARQMGLFSWMRRNIQVNPGAPYEFTWTVKQDGSVHTLAPQADGGIVINLDLDYTLDTANRVLKARPNSAKQLRVPKSVYIDMVMNALGAHGPKCIDLAVDFMIGQEPGTGNDQVFSFWSATYHLSDSPAKTRMIVGQFTWEVASTGSDGIRVMRVVGMNYPFTNRQYFNPAKSLTPNNNDNVIQEGMHVLQVPNNNWSIMYSTGTQVRQAHAEVLDFESEGRQNMEIIWYPGFQISTPGNANDPRVVFRRRGNKVTEATVGWGSGQAFNIEYAWVVIANPTWGWLQGVGAQYSGGAMNLMVPWDGSTNLTPPESNPNANKFVMYGATYVEGNWSLFVNADIGVTFNGQNVIAKANNWDLRDLTDVYKRQTFYIYCIMNGSDAFYEITKQLRNHNPYHVLVAVVTTDDFGIVTIERRQSFSIAGFPLTRTRDMGIPVSSGAVTEQGSYKFISRGELYDN